jgi:disulfide bond formation protein DsbB
MIETITTLLALLTLIANIAIILTVIAWVVNKYKPLPFLAPIKQLIRKHGLLLLLIIPLSAIAGSLYYEIHANFEPCLLCWWQRIFMYPQAVLIVAALYYKTRDIVKYLIPLSILGALTSGVHYFEQTQARLAPHIDPFVTCSYGDVSCSSSYIFQFGYITIPLMTLTAFILIIIISALLHPLKK